MRSIETRLKKLEKKFKDRETKVTIYKVILSISKPHFETRCKECDVPVRSGMGKIVRVITCDPECRFWEECD
jgi:ribosome-associated translation inhibitor RaiA